MNRLMLGVLAGLVLAGVSGTVYAEDAAKLFATKCAMCHGKDAKGSPMMAKKFGIDKLNLLDEASLGETDEMLIKATAEGAGEPSATGALPMPAYKGKIAEADIAALVGHVRSLAPAETESVPPTAEPSK